MKINFKEANKTGGVVVIMSACVYALLSLLYAIVAIIASRYGYVFTGQALPLQQFYPEWLTRTWQGIGLTLLWLPYIVFFGLDIYFDKRSGHKKNKNENQVER